MTAKAASGAGADFAADVAQEVAATWIARWDAQQMRYIADREERFAVIGDVVAHVVDDAAAPVVLDIGCGPGSLAGRLAHRLPHAVLLGVDIDPLLLALGRTRYGHRVHFIDADITAAGWTQALSPVQMIDAAVSTTALHWVPPEHLARLYVDIAALLRPGGILVNGDHLKLADQSLCELAEAAEKGRAERTGVTENEDWSTWWDEVTAEPALAELQARRVQRGLRHGYGNRLSVDEHVAMLRAAGFTSIGPVWQSGTDHILIARASPL
ncbi:MAG: class I SAM-dependent methyltransferase [Pseudonocardiaceae bacterium]